MDEFTNPLIDPVGATLGAKASECCSRRFQRRGIDAKRILEAIEPPSRLSNLEERAAQFAVAAARLVGGDRCVIVLLEDADPARPVLRLLSRGFAEPSHSSLTAVEEAAARDAIVSGRRVLVDARAPREAGGSSAGEEGAQRAAAIIACPIRIDGTIVGAICVVGRGAFRRVRPDDLAAIEIAGCMVGHTLQSSRLQNLLKSQFAQLAMSREGGASPDHALALSNAHPGQLCRILAKSFYREMIKLGFESGQIISAASEIISQLSGSLRKHKERWQRKGEGRGKLAADRQ